MYKVIMYKEPSDKCQICGYVGLESEFEETYKENYEGDGLVCPNCGSFDVDDIGYNPYTDDERYDEIF